MDPSQHYFGWSDEDEDSDTEDEDSDTEDHGKISELKELCLLRILQNFDRFWAAFKMRNSKVPKEHQEFLARLYSEKIFEKLKAAGKLNCGHLDFLINPDMKKLDIVGMDYEILPDVVRRLKKRGANILSFKGRCRDVGEDMCTPLMSALPKVEEIDYFHDELFSGLETKSLKEKILCFGKMSAPKRFARISQIFKAIGQNCRCLKSLTFDFYFSFEMKKYNKGIAFILKNCPFLETLQYGDAIGALYELHKRDLPLLKNYKKRSPKKTVKYILKNLTSDTSRYYPLLDALEICVATCPCVSRLYMDCLDTDEELEVISRFTQLQEIKFKTTGELSSSCLGKFLELRGNKLTSLEMPYKSVLPIETLIESCPKLQSLILSYVQFPEPNGTSEKSCKASLPDLKTVEFLSMDFLIPEIGAALKMIVSAAKNIEKLSLKSSSGLTNKFLTSLDLSGVLFLDASASDVTVDFLTELVLHGSLKTLQINFCKNVSYEDYLNLKRFVSHNNKNVHIKCHLKLVSSFWRNCVRSSIANIPRN